MYVVAKLEFGSITQGVQRHSLGRTLTNGAIDCCNHYKVDLSDVLFWRRRGGHASGVAPLSL